MAITHDAAAIPANALYTATFSWTHTPVGTPRGAAVVVVQEGSTDQVSGVTYGGVAMTRVRSDVRTATEAGRTYLYFLGASVPTGARTVQVTLTGTADTNAVSYTVTSAAVDTAVDVSAGADAGIIANPSLAISPTAAAVIYYGLFSGLAAPVTTVQTGSTHVAGKDYGTDSAMWARKSVAGAGATTIGYTAASDDVCHSALAIKEFTATTFYQNTGGYTSGPVGTLARQTGKSAGGYSLGLTGTLATAATFAKTVGGFTSGPVGALVRLTSKGVGGFTSSPTGALARLTSKTAGGYSLGPTGGLATAGVFAKTVGGFTSGPIGTLVTAMIWGKTVGGAIIAPIGSLVRLVGKGVGGFTISPVGTLSRLTSTSTGGYSLGPIGGLVKLIEKGVGGFTLLPTGDLTSIKQTGAAAVSALLNFMKGRIQRVLIVQVAIKEIGEEEET